jgi:GNAT superfamily N-acetyltransferase
VTPTSEVVLRAATDDDVDAIAAVWHRAWGDGHLGNVPDELPRHRGLEDLRRQVPVRLATTTVATVGEDVVGFVVTHDDAVEQLYVDAPARGSGVAGALLTHAEAQIAGRVDVAGAEDGGGWRTAWLAVVPGNARARRFYERQGWSDAGPYDNPAFTADGSTILVPTRRYEKRLARVRVAAG